MYSEIIEQVVNAGLSRSDESMVLRLLNVVDAATGQVALLMDDFLHLTGVRSRGAALRYLSTLKQVGIITYRTNPSGIDAQVFVHFQGWQGASVEPSPMSDMQQLQAEVAELRGQMGEVLQQLARCGALESARGGGENGGSCAQISTDSRADFDGFTRRFC